MQIDSLVEKLCKVWSAGDPELAILYAVQQAFPDLSAIEPPIDLKALAFQRGISEIVQSDLECDGLISRNDTGGYTIQVNRRHSEAKKRFTIAHELGHTFFFDLEDNVKARVSVSDQGIESLTGNQTEERLCNVAAAEILLPRKQFLARLSKGVPTAGQILSLAKTFDASVFATARRAVDLCPHNLLVVRWQYTESLGAYKSVWIARGNSRIVNKNNPLVVGEDQPIFAAFRSAEPFRGREWVSLGGPLGHYFVDGVSMNGKAGDLLTVFILERIAERLIESGSIPPNPRTVDQPSLY